MTKEVVTIPSSATVAEAIRLMAAHGWRSLIVDRDHEQDAYGIITETDITCKTIAVGKDPQQIQVRDVMTKPCIVVNPDLSVENVVKLFANNHLLRAPVIQGQLLGIISISDILVKSTVTAQLDALFPNQNFPALVQQARTLYTEDRADSKNRAVTWDAIEEKLAQLSQQKAEIVLKTALEEYFEEFEELEESNILDNLCSG